MASDRISLNGSASKRKPTLDERNRLADQTLSARYDTLNQLFTVAEQRLKALKPLYPVWVDYGHESGDGVPERWEVLGVAKYEGKWRLCHAYDSEENDDGSLSQLKPIVECPVDVRVRAASMVRKLYKEIVKSKEEYIPKVDEAVRELTDFCGEC